MPCPSKAALSLARLNPCPSGVWFRGGAGVVVGYLGADGSSWSEEVVVTFGLIALRGLGMRRVRGYRASREFLVMRRLNPTHAGHPK
jgi:hypothetical protein